MDRSDWLVLVGVLLMLGALWFMFYWAGILLWAGLMMTSVGIAEARRGK